MINSLIALQTHPKILGYGCGVWIIGLGGSGACVCVSWREKSRITFLCVIFIILTYFCVLYVFMIVFPFRNWIVTYLLNRRLECWLRVATCTINTYIEVCGLVIYARKDFLAIPFPTPCFGGGKLLFFFWVGNFYL